LKIVEKASIDYSFLQQKDAYIIQYGLWAAMNHIRRIRYKYSMWNGELEIEDFDELYYYTGRAGHCPETSIEVQEIHDLVDMCPTEYQTIWRLLSAGYKYGEIGELLGLSVYAIGTRKKNLLHVVREAYHEPLCRKSAVLEKLNCM